MDKVPSLSHLLKTPIVNFVIIETFYYVETACQCCQIGRFIANLATFEHQLRLLLGARDFPFLATFLATFEFVARNIMAE